MSHGVVPTPAAGQDGGRGWGHPLWSPAAKIPHRPPGAKAHHWSQVLPGRSILAHLAHLSSEKDSSPSCPHPRPPFPVPSLLPALSPQLKEKYGPVFTVYLGPRPVVVLCGHEAVKEALQYVNENAPSQLVSEWQLWRGWGWAPAGVAFANGERWRVLRRFSLTTLRNFGMGKRSIEERIQEEAQCLLREFPAPFDPTFFLSRTVSNVISSVVFGHRFDYEDKRFLSLLHVINESFIQMSTPWAQVFIPASESHPAPLARGPSLSPRSLKNFVAEQVRGNRESLDSSNPRDFIDCFLIKMEQERNDPLSEFNLKNLVLTALNLFFAGTETVSTTLRYGFLLLMKYPEVEGDGAGILSHPVHEEIDRVIGRERIPGIEDRMGMPYTDAVIHEIQRVTDIVPMGVPRAVTRDTHFRGYILPKGTDVFPLLGSALRDPKYFSCPDGFNPGHFLDDEGRFKKNEAFVPFASGRRVCLGEAMARMELFLYFTTVLQSFSLRSLIPAKDIDISPQVSGFSNIPPTYKFCVVPR
uniref:Cytochrome P450 n=1 Tax=Ornithorhynchus anatinus TaxID=9258 RepID=A0A6I8N1W9_ORNAN